MLINYCLYATITKLSVQCIRIRQEKLADKIFNGDKINVQLQPKSSL